MKYFKLRFFSGFVMFLILLGGVHQHLQAKIVYSFDGAHDTYYDILRNVIQKNTFMDFPSQIHVTGLVKDKLGNPLIGVTIKVKEKPIGTVTDKNGKFALDVSPTDSLVISYIGYLTQTIAVRNQSDMNIILKATEGSLNEVVVVAYGEQKKASVTGAIASIGTKELKQSPAANLEVSLAGRLPGLTAIQRSGQPGRDNTLLYIRGRSTVNEASPIILVDGVERDITYVDPNEVASVTILKDASATALYGVRGANGVILVTTKRGTKGKPMINLTAETGAQTFTRYLHPLNSYDYARTENLALENDGSAPLYNGDQLAHYKNGDNPMHYPNTNWRKILEKKYALQQRYNLNISGGGDLVQYFVNAGYLEQGGQFKVEDGLPYDPSFKLNRYTFRSNIDLELNKTLKAYLNLAGYIEKQNQPRGYGQLNPSSSPAVNILASINFLTPVTPGPLTPDGEILTNDKELMPAYGMMNRAGYVRQDRTSITATYGMDQNLDFLTKGLSAKVEMSFDTKATNYFIGTKDYEVYQQVIDHLPNGQDTIFYDQLNNVKNTPLNITGQEDYNSLTNIRGYLNYSRLFNEHSVSGMILFQKQKQVINHELPYNLIGISSRLAYGYDNKYFLEFDAGYNGSEQFAPSNRFGFFPAISAGWVISNEEFLKGNKIIDYLKLRGSYGKVGNDKLGGNRFLYLSNIQLAGGGLSSLDQGKMVSTILIGNPHLQWETSLESNLGLEIEIFNSLNLTIDIFQQKRDNILVQRASIPLLNGLDVSALPPANIGSVVNKGYEIVLDYKKVFSKDLSFMAKMNFNYAKNKVLFADEPLLPDDYAYQYRQTGYPIGQQFGYIVEGYFGSNDQISKSPVQSVGGHVTRPGDFKYANLNGDSVVNEKDRAPIGYSNVPEITFGAAFSLSYKEFDLSILFQGVTRVSNYYSGWGVFPNGNFLPIHQHSWTEERAKNGELITYPRLTTQTSPNQIANSFFIKDGSYIRLKNMELGYSLPDKWVKSMGIGSVRFYLNGLNLFTWDKLGLINIDPEIMNGTTYPDLKVYNMGINIIF